MSQVQEQAAAAPRFVNRSVHLHKLRKGRHNVRTVGAGTPKKPRMTHAQLVESIAAIGLITPLVVVPGEEGFFDVEAGGGRLDALVALAQAGRLDNLMIDCREVSSADPVAISLIENVV